MINLRSNSKIGQASLISIALFFLTSMNCSFISFRKEHHDDSALKNARMLLRTKQRENVSTEMTGSNEQLVTDAALEHLEELTQFVPTDDPNSVRRGAFIYDRRLEFKRIERARAIIRRVEPGPFEDPNYFAILSFQAASIEMVFDDIFTRGGRDAFSKFLFGTVAAPDPNALTQSLTSDSCTIVVLYSGLVDFIYQAAKVVVEAINPTRSTDGQSALTVVLNPEVIRARLDSNPEPAERLYRTLEAYFFYGYPRALWHESVPLEHSPVLSVIVGMAERWSIGHEYGHGSLASVHFAKTLPGVSAFMSEEYFADCIATIATVYSAHKLDGLCPEDALGGTIFALACLDILQRASNILRTGEEASLDTDEEKHLEARALNAIYNFRQFFDVHYHPDGSCDVAFHVKTEIPEHHDFSIEHSKNAYGYANVLQYVWELVKERLLDDFRAKRQLHPSWRGVDVK